MIKTEDVYIITVSLALHFKNHSNLHNTICFKPNHRHAATITRIWMTCAVVRSLTHRLTASVTVKVSQSLLRPQISLEAI